MTALRILRADGVLSVQDMGRPGHIAQGLSRGGGADRMAVIEAAALLRAPSPLAGVEMAGAGGRFAVTQPMRVALTGAPMVAMLDGQPVAWHACHLIQPGQVLTIGAALGGVYGYLTPAGGITTPEWLGSRAAHLSIGIGAALTGGDLPCAPDPAPDDPPRIIDPALRFGGGRLRMTCGPQTDLFTPDTRTAFHNATFARTRGNRQGITLHHADRFTTDRAAGLASDVIGPGDVQMTGDGVPVVLLAECQTIGGYPRIGTVIPDDLPRAAQAPVGAELRLTLITLEEADALHRTDAQLLRDAGGRCRPLIRDPRDIPNLLSYQFISGAVRGDET
ncbi:biotin-dependent carboxyltransferase family protein [Paracoccus sp. (in: a-proteobacteria)]|uniref:5-oxoprolinase subunit C family protein n=1 Tax=Paracoccus sp. TaxID=267 RepID=UPI0026DFD189|nr:urea amidolyase [Paracoccus sp. (in: a-proteobacteria)]MDO5647777.1 urea amidolyase [Paracoccus sp. (in: a-proteobacteria)]